MVVNLLRVPFLPVFGALWRLGDDLSNPAAEPWDFLDSVVPVYGRLHPRQIIFLEDSPVVPILGGLWRSYLGSPLNISMLASSFFSQTVGVILIALAIPTLAFYALSWSTSKLVDTILPDRCAKIASLLTCQVICVLPFYLGVGAAIVATPLIVVWFISEWYGSIIANARAAALVGICLIGSLAYTAPILATLILGFIFGGRLRRQLPCLLRMCLAALIVDYPTVMGLFTAPSSHRQEMKLASTRLNLEAIVDAIWLSMRDPLFSRNGHARFVGPFTLIVVLFLVFLVRRPRTRTYGLESYSNCFFGSPLAVLYLSASIVSVIPNALLRAFSDRFDAIQMPFLNFARSEWLSNGVLLVALVIYFSISCSHLMAQTRTVGANFRRLGQCGQRLTPEPGTIKYLISVLLLIFGAYHLASSLISLNKDVKNASVQMNDYYASDSFQTSLIEICRNRNVIHLGMNPAVGISAGLTTLDGYWLQYPLEHKHFLEDLLQPSFIADEENRYSSYFLNWGSRAYLYQPEFGKLPQLGVRRLESITLTVDYQVLAGTSPLCLVSTSVIANAGEIGLSEAYNAAASPFLGPLRIYLSD